MYEHWRLLCRIIDAGITVVTLDDDIEYSVRTLTKDPDLVQKLLGKMQRANSESRRKTDLLTETWVEKRADMRKDLTPHGANCPAWLRLSCNRQAYEVILERREIVRRIVSESTEGMGKDKIARRLNADGVKPFGSASGWLNSYVAKIIENRALIGEYQPHEKSANTENKRRPIGNPHRELFSGGHQPRRMASDARQQGSKKRRGWPKTQQRPRTCFQASSIAQPAEAGCTWKEKVRRASTRSSVICRVEKVRDSDSGALLCFDKTRTHSPALVERLRAILPASRRGSGAGASEARRRDRKRRGYRVT